MKYRCSKCMFEFDEDIEGTKFENLPEDWRCPECGGQVYYFEKEDNSSGNHFEGKRQEMLREIDELSDELKNENLFNQDTPNYQKIITREEIVGLIILIIVCSFIGWGIVSFCNFLIHNM